MKSYDVWSKHIGTKWHKLTLNSVAHTRQVIMFLLISVVYSCAWMESVQSMVVSPKHSRGSISDHGCAAVFSHGQHSPGPTTTIFPRSHLLQLFPLQKSKFQLKGTRFQDNKEIQENATRQVFTISKRKFQEC